MAGDPSELITVSHFTINLGGPEGAGYFRSCSLGSNSTPTLKFDHTDDQGNPVSLVWWDKTTQWSDITLERGMDKNMDLWTWRQQVIDGDKTAKKDITITGLGRDLSPVATWNIKGAFPSSYQGAVMSASDDNIGIEMISLAHDGWTRE